MEQSLGNYKKNSDYLICLDSDGCVMNTMDIKHMRCFGPCMIEEWGLSQWKAPVLKKWNELNLYSMTRGINRFKGLARMLREVNETCIEVTDISVLEQWVKESLELSEEALRAEIKKKNSVILKKALAWSEEVNRRIDDLKDEDKRPFEGVKEPLACVYTQTDVAVVSSANYEAVEEEWKENGLLDYVDVLLAQDAGSKAYCIRELLKKGYEKENVLMVGDAPGDYDAARENGVFFYPVLVCSERKSWDEFRESAFEKFIKGNYGGAYQREKADLFFDNLKGRG